MQYAQGIGIPRGRLSGLPRFGIHVRRSGVAVRVSCSWPASRHRWAGGKDFTPSIPAGCFPRLSWVTRRTAHKRAYQDLVNRLWRLCTVLTSPRCVAWYMRFWRRKTCRWTCFQGMPCQAAIRVCCSCVLARNLGRTTFPCRTPARRQPILGVTPGLGVFGPPALPWHMVGTYAVK
jgi:hypothetical protein